MCNTQPNFAFFHQKHPSFLGCHAIVKSKISFPPKYNPFPLTNPKIQTWQIPHSCIMLDRNKCEKTPSIRVWKCCPLVLYAFRWFGLVAQNEQRRTNDQPPQITLKNDSKFNFVSKIFPGQDLRGSGPCDSHSRHVCMSSWQARGINCRSILVRIVCQEFFRQISVNKLQLRVQWICKTLFRSKRFVLWTSLCVVIRNENDSGTGTTQKIVDQSRQQTIGLLEPVQLLSGLSFEKGCVQKLQIISVLDLIFTRKPQVFTRLSVLWVQRHGNVSGSIFLALMFNKVVSRSQKCSPNSGHFYRRTNSIQTT